MRLRIEIGRLEGRVRKAMLMMLLAVVSSSAVAEWVVRVDGVKQHGRVNDIHPGRLDGDECRCLGGHRGGSFL